jgi:hypothetical protein
MTGLLLILQGAKMSNSNIAEHLETLQVSWGASAETIRHAWKRAVKTSHPDVYGPEGHAMMTRINEAYQALKNGAPDGPSEAVKYDPDEVLDMEHVEYVFTRDHRYELHAAATEEIGVTLGVHVPVSLITNGGHLHFRFDDVALRKGDFLVLPICHLAGDEIEFSTQEFVHAEISKPCRRGWPEVPLDGFDDEILTDWHGVEITISALIEE